MRGHGLGSGSEQWQRTLPGSLGGEEETRAKGAKGPKPGPKPRRREELSSKAGRDRSATLALPRPELSWQKCRAFRLCGGGEGDVFPHFCLLSLWWSESRLAQGPAPTILLKGESGLGRRSVVSAARPVVVAAQLLHAACGVL